jgi:uncharacterized Zn-binding protein involved in type VI secretion
LRLALCRAAATYCIASRSSERRHKNESSTGLLRPPTWPQWPHRTVTSQARPRCANPQKGPEAVSGSFQGPVNLRCGRHRLATAPPVGPRGITAISGIAEGRRLLPLARLQGALFKTPCDRKEEKSTSGVERVMVGGVRTAIVGMEHLPVLEMGDEPLDRRAKRRDLSVVFFGRQG